MLKDALRCGVLLSGVLAGVAWAQELPSAPSASGGGQPKIQVNFLNTCRPAQGDLEAMGRALAQVKERPRFAADFEISRGVTTLTEAEARAAGAPEGSAAEPSSWVRIRKEFPEKAVLTDAQYSLSVEGNSASEALALHLRDSREVLQILISDTVAGSAAQVVSAATPPDRIRIERFGKASIVLARCGGVDQSAYEPLFRGGGWNSGAVPDGDGGEDGGSGGAGSSAEAERVESCWGKSLIQEREAKERAMAEDIREVVIMGSGCSGLTAAIYAGRANLKPLVLEGHEPGGQLSITTLVENFPGWPEGIQGPELIEKMHKQAERFGAEFSMGHVTAADLTLRPFVLTVGKQQIKTRTLIIASGASARWLGLPSEKALIGHGVSSCATCDGFFFSGKEVAVIGGGDSAMEEALFLTRFASKVTLIHRRDAFRASKIMLDRARAHEKIHFMTDTVVEEVMDVAAKEVTALKLRNLLTGKVWDFPTSAMFLGIGHTPNAAYLPRHAGERRRRLPDGARLRTHGRAGCVCVRRCGGPALPAGDHGLGHGMHGGDGGGEASGRAGTLKEQVSKFQGCKVARVQKV